MAASPTVAAGVPSIPPTPSIPPMPPVSPTSPVVTATSPGLIPITPLPLGLIVNHFATRPQVAAGQPITYQLLVRNFDLFPRRGLDLIDVLPFRGDGRTPSTTFAGTVRLVEPLVLPAGELATYTSAAPTTISVDPTVPANQPGGQTRWCAAADFGGEGCPGRLADVTAVRVTRSTALAPGEAVARTLILVADGAHDGDRVTNRFAVRAAGLDLASVANDVPVVLSAGRIGRHVWLDNDHDGIRDPAEPPLAGAAVRLTGRGADGRPVSAVAVSDDRGEYLFDGLPAGTYRIRVTPPNGTTYAFTTTGGGADPQSDSDAGADGLTAPIDLVADRAPDGIVTSISGDVTIDVGLVPADTVATSAADDVPPPGGRASGTTVAGRGSLRPATFQPGPEIGRAVGIGLLLTAASTFVLAGCVLVARRRRPDMRNDALLWPIWLRNWPT